MSARPAGGGRVRAVLQRITLPLFKLGLVASLLLGGVLILTQIVGLLIGDANLVSAAAAKLSRPMIVTACFTGQLSFVMSYIFKWKSGED